jgi:hypothetical protein
MGDFSGFVFQDIGIHNQQGKPLDKSESWVYDVDNRQFALIPHHERVVRTWRDCVPVGRSVFFLAIVRLAGALAAHSCYHRHYCLFSERSGATLVLSHVVAQFAIPRRP